MKITFCTLIMLGLVMPITLRAQDAPSRPLKDPGLEIEPTPLPKSSATPAVAPTPRATPHKVELPSPKATPSATPEASQPPTPTSTPEKSATETKEAAAETTPTPVTKKRTRAARRRIAEEPAAATPQPTPLSRRDMRDIAAKLKNMEREWEAAFNDPAVIEKSLADDFVGTSPVGDVTTKKELLRDAKKDNSPTPKTITRDLDVNFYAPDIAIVTGAARQIVRNRSGQIVEYNYRFTDTWVERDGEWRCFASQSMLIPAR